MGIMTTLFKPQASAFFGGTRASEFMGVQAWIDDTGGLARGTSAGVPVSPTSSLSASAVFACVRVIAEDVAKLPVILYRRTETEFGKGKELASDHRVYDILKYEPNEDMGPFDCKQAIMVSALTWGNGYARIVRNGFQEPKGYVPLPSWKVEPKRDTEDSRIVYKYRKELGQEPEIIEAQDIIHIKGITPDGLVGWALSSVGSESMGLYLAALQFTASYFANGASTGEAIIYPNAMKPEEFSAWVGAMRQQYEGAGKQHKTRYFDRGVDIKKGGGIDPESSQLIESLHFSIEDVARYFRVTPHKIGHLLRSTFNNIESLDLDHYKSTIQPRLVQIEEEFSRKLLTQAERREMVIEHKVDMLLRADYKTRTEGYSRALTDGWLSPNEVRAMENMNPIPGGEMYRVQQNMALLGEDGEVQPVSGEPDTAEQPPAPPPSEAVASMMPVVAHVAERIIDRERMAISRVKGDVVAWSKDWYAKHREYVTAEVKPLVQVISGMVNVSADSHAAIINRISDCHEAESMRLIESGRDNMGEELERWRIERSPYLARRIVDEVLNERP